MARHTMIKMVDGREYQITKDMVSVQGQLANGRLTTMSDQHIGDVLVNPAYVVSAHEIEWVPENF